MAVPGLSRGPSQSNRSAEQAAEALELDLVLEIKVVLVGELEGGVVRLAVWPRTTAASAIVDRTIRGIMVGERLELRD
jgi:hypothetical protein